MFIKLISFLILVYLCACNRLNTSEHNYIILLSPYSCVACSPIYFQNIQYLIRNGVAINIVMPKIRDKELKKYFGDDLYLKIKPCLLIGDEKYFQLRKAIDYSHSKDEINYLFVTDHNKNIISYFPLKYLREENLLAIINKSQLAVP